MAAVGPVAAEAHVVSLGEAAPGFVRFRLRLSAPGAFPALAAGRHLKLFVPNPRGSVPGEWNGRPDPEHGQHEVSRRYTPIASDQDAGWFDFVVELISPERAPPDGGKFSRFAVGLALHAPIRVSGPHGVYSYLSEGRFTKQGKAVGELRGLRVQDVAIVCAGVAANTALNLAGAMLREPADAGPRVWLIVAGRAEASLLHREAFEQLAAEQPKRCRVWFVLEKSSPHDWPYGTGNLADALVPEHMPEAGPSTLLISTGMSRVKQACHERFPKLGYGAGGGCESTGGTWWHWNEELD